MKASIFTSAILLLTMGLSAGTNMICKDGVCIIDISNLSSDNTIEKVKKERNLFRHIRKERENEIETIVLAHEKYIMTIAEVEDIEETPIQLTVPNENVGNKIIEKTTLPTSEYFCEKNKKAVYHKETDSFECA